MTKLLYLTDTYLFESHSNIIQLWNDDFWDYIILDATIFYPQWWGQPSDTGTISLWENIFEVTKCMLDENGTVLHYGNFIKWEFSAWEKVHLKIDSEKRTFNARNHSAGHLVDVAMEICKYTKLTAWKGFHFPEGSYVEYHWEISADLEIMKEKMSSTLKGLSGRNIPILIYYTDLWDLEAPVWKNPRFVKFEWYKGCWCWGTHVKSSSEIGEVSIRKMKWKKWVLKVSYEVTQ